MTELMVVLLPDQWGELAVCDFGQLMEHLMNDEPVDDAIDNSAIEAVREPTTEFLARVRALNATGDVGAYWERT